MESTDPRKKVHYWRWLAIVLFLAAAIWAISGYWPDSNFTLEHLRGLTPEQVIDRLGVPRVDERLPTFGSWTPAKEPEEGPLKFYYYGTGWQGFEYAVIFKDGRVADVKIGTK